MIRKHTITTSGAPSALGPYSQGVEFWNLVFTSMQIPIDPNTGKLIEGGVEEQTKRVIENIKAIVEAGGSSLEEVVKVTVYVDNIESFSEVNDAYSVYFSEKPPARSFVVVSSLPAGAKVAMDAIAVRE